MIYIVQDTASSLVKIGFTDSARRRLSKMQSDCPTELRLVALLDGSRNAERELHVQFSAHRERGEWFRPHPDILMLGEASASLPTLKKPAAGKKPDDKACKQVGELFERAELSGQPMLPVLKRAGVAYSTWTRWKQGADPQLSTLDRVLAALDELIEERAEVLRRLA